MIISWKYAILLCAAAADILLTYFSVKKMSSMYGDCAARASELNPVVRFLWGRFGLKTGTIIGAIFVATVMSIIFIGIPAAFHVDSEYVDMVFWFAMGAYMVVIFLHLNNIDSLRENDSKEKCNQEDCAEISECFRALDSLGEMEDIAKDGI